LNGIDFDGSPWDEMKFGIHPKHLNPKGVGDLTMVPNINNVGGRACLPGDTCVLDNRHVTSDLKESLCDATPVDMPPIMLEQGADPTVGGVNRYYLDAMLYLAWPENAKLQICCDDPAFPDASEKCGTPSFTLPTESGELAIAPHFLTPLFEERQQEALTAAFVAKFNTLGKRMHMDLAGRFDLGPAGIKMISREDPSKYHYELGQSWGNMFLDCEGQDEDHPFCQASMENERILGRNVQYHKYPMFSCSGESLYPTKTSGKSCYSLNMETNIAGGCDIVAAVGGCDTTCIGGFCGASEPPLDGLGTSNVLYVYMDEKDIATTSGEADDSVKLIISVVLPIVAAVVLLLGLIVWKNRKSSAPGKGPVPEECGTISEETDEEEGV